MSGLIPVKKGSNSYYTAGVNKYYVPSTDNTALYLGDPVSLAGSADALGNYATVTKATLSAAAQWLGVVVGVLPVDGAAPQTTPLTTVYRPASIAAYVLVADDPDQEFIIGEDALGAAIAAADVGNIGIAVAGGGGSTYYGRSSVVLDSSSFPSGTANGQLKLLGLVHRPDLVLGTGTTAGAFFRVKINGAMHELVTPATTEP